jgi:hypothetical protein
VKKSVAKERMLKTEIRQPYNLCLQQHNFGLAFTQNIYLFNLLRGTTGFNLHEKKLSFKNCE